MRAQLATPGLLSESNPSEVDPTMSGLEITGIVLSALFLLLLLVNVKDITRYIHISKM
jgi:hypothetical protein